MGDERQMNLAQRLGVYQAERFPLAAHGLLVAALTVGAVGYARGGVGWPGLRVWLAAFGVLLAAFLLLRIADEFKDAADDAAYRPYRPVPRGLVTLGELAGVGVVAALAQLALTLALGAAMLPYLLALWAMTALLRWELFVHDWLRAHPLLYMLSHMLILPVIVLYALAAAWQGQGSLSGGAAWLLVASYANGLVFEIGRKLRAPEYEEPGVETYSALWGIPVAAWSWAAAVGAAALAGTLAGVGADKGLWLGAVAVVGVGGAIWAAATMQRRRSHAAAKWIERISALWVLLFYLALGLLP